MTSEGTILLLVMDLLPKRVIKKESPSDKWFFLGILKSDPIYNNK